MTTAVSTRRTIRAAVFGTGGWACYAHLPTLVSTPDVQVVGCVDASLDRATAVAHSFGVDGIYSTLDELFDTQPDLDLLVISAPDDHHAAAMRASVMRGVAVFCEKPLANDAPTAVAMADLVDASGVPATVGYSFRYSPAIQALRADLQSGELGAIWLIELAEHNAQFHPLVGREINWKGDPSVAAAGALLEYGSHVLDLCLWLFGPVASVSSHLIRVRTAAQLDDIATLQFRLTSGAAGTMLCSWLLTGGYPGIRIRVHCSGGLAEVELSDQLPRSERYIRYGNDGAMREMRELAPLTGGNAPYTHMHMTELLARIRGGGRMPSFTLPTVRQAAETQQLLDTALAATRRWTSVTAMPS